MARCYYGNSRYIKNKNGKKWETAVHLAVAGGVFDGVFLCCPFSHYMSWMRSGTHMSQFQRDLLPTLIGKDSC